MNKQERDTLLAVLELLDAPEANPLLKAFGEAFVKVLPVGKGPTYMTPWGRKNPLGLARMVLTLLRNELEEEET
jgi:hypothetical protein